MGIAGPGAFVQHQIEVTEHMAKVVGIDLGTTNSVVAVMEGSSPAVIPNAEGVANDALGRRIHENRRTSRRATGKTPSDHQPGSHDLFDQASHGRRRLSRQDRRQGLYAARDLRDDSAKARERREQLFGRTRHQSGHHRSRVLQRRAASGDQRRRQDRRPRSAAHHQRADGGGARVRSR